ncbi:hypothetical protein [Streptomyces sp. NPDC002779]|uniref:hypothetical protein n=1 Tax=Streptomyces sp. NPDC002779 TaxID=3364664 RepID=UPI0036CA5EA8
MERSPSQGRSPQVSRYGTEGRRRRHSVSLTPPAARAHTSADADAIVFMPCRRRVWTPADPSPVHGLRDVALKGSPSG